MVLFLSTDNAIIWLYPQYRPLQRLTISRRDSSLCEELRTGGEFPWLYFPHQMGRVADSYYPWGVGGLQLADGSGCGLVGHLGRC